MWEEVRWETGWVREQLWGWIRGSPLRTGEQGFIWYPGRSLGGVVQRAEVMDCCHCNPGEDESLAVQGNWNPGISDGMAIKYGI